MQFFQSVSLSERKLLEKYVDLFLLFCFSLLGYCYILCSASSWESALCVGVCLVLLKARNAVLSWGFLLSWSPLFSHWGWAQGLYLPEGEVGEIKREGDKVLWEGLQGCAPKSLWLYWNLVYCQPGCDHILAPLGILSVATGTTRHHSLPPLLLGVSYR